MCRKYIRRYPVCVKVCLYVSNTYTDISLHGPSCITQQFLSMDQMYILKIYIWFEKAES